MSELLQLLISVLAGSFALPAGLLPSIFLFRDLANGIDASASAKRAYAWTLWGGLAVAWIVGAVLAYLLLDVLFD